jgi:hypothetical protein
MYRLEKYSLFIHLAQHTLSVVSDGAASKNNKFSLFGSSLIKLFCCP